VDSEQDQIRDGDVTHADTVNLIKVREGDDDVILMTSLESGRVEKLLTLGNTRM